jgi:hypothetical protein
MPTKALAALLQSMENKIKILHKKKFTVLAQY